MADIPTPPHIDLMPLSANPFHVPALWTRPPAPATVDRFVAEGLVRPDDVNFIFRNVYRQLAIITVGGGLAVSAAWTTYLLRGGLRGIWTRGRDPSALLMGGSTAFIVGCTGGYTLGEIWVAEMLFREYPQKAEQNLLVYRYAQAAKASSLPPLGSGPLFDANGQARFDFVGSPTKPNATTAAAAAPAAAIETTGRPSIEKLLKALWGKTTDGQGQADQEDAPHDGETESEQSRVLDVGPVAPEPTTTISPPPEPVLEASADSPASQSWSGAWPSVARLSGKVGGWLRPGKKSSEGAPAEDPLGVDSHTRP